MDPIVIDLETYFDNKYTLRQMPTEEYINDPRFELLIVGWTVVGSHETYAESVDGLSLLERLLLLRGKLHLDKRPVIAFNSNFDMGVLAFQHSIRSPFNIDVQALARPLYFAETGSASLHAYCTYLKLGVKGTTVTHMSGKREATTDPEVWLQYRRYCMNDVDLTYELYERVMQAWDMVTLRSELKVIHTTIKMFTDPVFTMDTQGASDFVAAEKDKLDKLLDTLFINKEDLRKNKVFSAALVDLGVTDIPTKFSPTTGKETYAFAKTDRGFQALLNHRSERVRLLCEARVQANSSIVSTRTERLLGTYSRMGRLPVPLTYYGTHTGRYAGTDRVNMQNLPPSLREFLTAPPGYVIMASDLAQIEPRMTACFCKHHKLVDIFKTGGDPYAVEAANIFGYATAESMRDQLSEEDYARCRFIGKTAVLGLGYGMGAERYKEQTRSQSNGDVDLVLDEANRIVRAYRDNNRPIKSMWQTLDSAMAYLFRDTNDPAAQVGCLVIKRESVLLPNGLRLHYKDPMYIVGVHDDGSERQEFVYLQRSRNSEQGKKVRLWGSKLLENIIQALAAILVRKYMADLLGKVENLGGRIVLQAHDEIVMVVPEQTAEELARYVDYVMTQPPEWMPELPLKVETNYGRSYKDCK